MGRLRQRLQRASAPAPLTALLGRKTVPEKSLPSIVTMSSYCRKHWHRAERTRVLVLGYWLQQGERDSCRRLAAEE
jgi:hypothetical protein